MHISKGYTHAQTSMGCTAKVWSTAACLRQQAITFSSAFRDRQDMTAFKEILQTLESLKNLFTS